MNGATPVLLEMRLFRVRPGTREEFHRITHEGTIPLMRSLGIDVLAYGPAANNDDLYYVLRAFSSEEQRTEQAHAFYSSPVWERDFDAPVMGMMEDYRIAVMPATPTLIAEFAAVPDGAVESTGTRA
jgi:hypothetical protein